MFQLEVSFVLFLSLFTCVAFIDVHQPLGAHRFDVNCYRVQLGNLQSFYCVSTHVQYAMLPLKTANYALGAKKASKLNIYFL